MSKSKPSRDSFFEGSPGKKAMQEQVKKACMRPHLEVGCLYNGAGTLSRVPYLSLVGQTNYNDREAFRKESKVLERAGLLLKTHTDPVSGNQVTIYDVGFSNSNQRVICGVFRPEHVHKFAPAIYDACPNTDWDKNIVWKDGLDDKWRTDSIIIAQVDNMRFDSGETVGIAILGGFSPYVDIFQRVVSPAFTLDMQFAAVELDAPVHALVGDRAMCTYDFDAIVNFFTSWGYPPEPGKLSFAPEPDAADEDAGTTPHPDEAAPPAASS